MLTGREAWFIIIIIMSFQQSVQSVFSVQTDSSDSDLEPPLPEITWRRTLPTATATMTNPAALTFDVRIFHFEDNKKTKDIIFTLADYTYIHVIGQNPMLSCKHPG